MKYSIRKRSSPYSRSSTRKDVTARKAARTRPTRPAVKVEAADARLAGGGLDELGLQLLDLLGLLREFKVLATRGEVLQRLAVGRRRVQREQAVHNMGKRRELISLCIAGVWVRIQRKICIARERRCVVVVVVDAAMGGRHMQCTATGARESRLIISSTLMPPRGRRCLWVVAALVHVPRRPLAQHVNIKKPRWVAAWCARARDGRLLVGPHSRRDVVVAKMDSLACVRLCRRAQTNQSFPTLFPPKKQPLPPRYCPSPPSRLPRLAFRQSAKRINNPGIHLCSACRTLLLLDQRGMRGVGWTGGGRCGCGGREYRVHNHREAQHQIELRTVALDEPIQAHPGFSDRL